MKNIVVLISGRGSNLGAVLRTAQSDEWQESIGARIAAVISNRPDATGLDVAARSGVTTAVVDHATFSSRDAFDAALMAAIDRHRPDLVLLAGFMRVLTPAFVAHYTGRLVNVHPSLLPAFPGLRTHRQALAAGVRVHGATVHFVSDRVDGGAIIAQAAVPVFPDDDEERLAKRVLAQEHKLVPRAVRAVLEGRIRFDNGRVVVCDVRPDDLALLV